jgi:hypothetical protein
MMKSAKAKAPAAVVKKAATIKAPKLSPPQAEMLKKIHGAGAAGYLCEKKGEQRTITALMSQKLVKKGAKNKEKNAFHYTVSKMGVKHLGA